jgi:hypothetical protein
VWKSLPSIESFHNVTSNELAFHKHTPDVQVELQDKLVEVGHIKPHQLD